MKIIDAPTQDGKTERNRDLWLEFTVTKQDDKPEVISLKGWGKDATLTAFFVEKASK